MKILMASHYFASHKGGIEIVAEQLFRQFETMGQQVVWMAGNASPPPESLGSSRTVSLRVFNLVEQKIGLPFPIPTLGALRRIRAEVGEADVVILHDCLYPSNIAAFVAARVRGINTIIVQHIGFVPYRNLLLNTLLKTANSFITRPMLRRAAQVIFISNTTRKFFEGVHFTVTPETIFNGVDTALYRTLLLDESIAELRNKYRLPLDRPAILFVGRFVEKKGLAALKCMASQRPNYTWAFAGWGPLDPRKWNASNVRVLTGLKGESMAALYRACDLLALPSTGEGFPLVVQEAIASGLAVVCGAETLTADPELRQFARGVAVYADDE